MCGWARMVTNRETYSGIVSLDSAETNAFDHLTLQTDSDGSSLKVWTRGASSSVLATLSEGEDFFFALTQSGTSATGYYSAASSNTLASAGVTGTSYTAAAFYAGRNSYADTYDIWWNGHIWNLMVFDAALSQAQLLVQKRYLRPVYPANINFWYTLRNSSDTSDKSGNGRNPSVGGTLVDGDTGVNLWVPRRKLILPAASEQFITITSIASGEVFGDAIVALDAGDQSVSPNGISTTESVGSHTVANVGPQSVEPSAVASAEAFGTAVVADISLNISPSGVASAESFGNAAITDVVLTIQPSGISSAEVFGTAVVADVILSIAPSAVDSSETFGSHTIAGVVAQTITPSGVAGGEAFGTAIAADVQLSIVVTGISSAETFGSHVVSGDSLQLIVPGGAASAEAFGSHTISNLVAQSVLPSAITSGEAFGAATLTQPSQTITVSAISSAEAFGSATLNILVQTITPSGIATGAAFGLAVLDGGVPPEESEAHMFVSLTQPLWVPLWTSVTK